MDVPAGYLAVGAERQGGAVPPGELKPSEDASNFFTKV
jgi:hypothetical protein